MARHPSSGNNHTTSPPKGAKGERRNKGVKAARNQERRERAYARGADRPKERA